MKITDHSADPLVSGLTEMTRRIESSRTPFEAFKAVLDGLTAALGRVACLHLSTRGLPAGQYRVVLLRIPEANIDLQSDPWTDDQLPVHSGGVIGEVLRNPRPQIAHDVG